MNALSSWLNKAYYLDASIRHRLLQALAFSSFVFVFLSFFRPFGIHQLGSLAVSIAFDFAGLTFVCMLLLNILVPKAFPKFFHEEAWTVGRELFYSSVNVVFIGLANGLLSIYLKLADAHFSVLAMFLVYTLSIAIFPISGSIIYKEMRARKQYEEGSAHLNEVIVPIKLEEEELIVLKGQNGEDFLQVHAGQLLYLVSADNYVEVHYLNNNQTVKKLLRNPLKIYEVQLIPYLHFWRCHKSYLVNLNRVERVSGNAQGYKLHLLGTTEQVPVSRSNNTVLKEKLKNQS